MLSLYGYGLSGVTDGVRAAVLVLLAVLVFVAVAVAVGVLDGVPVVDGVAPNVREAVGLGVTEGVGGYVTKLIVCNKMPA